MRLTITALVCVLGAILAPLPASALDFPASRFTSSCRSPRAARPTC